MKILKIIYFFIAFTIAISTSSCHNKTEDCIDEITKKAITEEGVKRGIENCYVKNSSQKTNQSDEQKSQIVEDCQLTWSGESFVKGTPAQNNNYFIVTFSNSTSIAYLPKNMSKEIAGQLITDNWELIKSICPAIKASEIK